jgi:hypothetical protein
MLLKISNDEMTPRWATNGAMLVENGVPIDRIYKRVKRHYATTLLISKKTMKKGRIEEYTGPNIRVIENPQSLPPIAYPRRRCEPPEKERMPI